MELLGTKADSEKINNAESAKSHITGLKSARMPLLQSQILGTKESKPIISQIKVESTIRSSSQNKLSDDAQSSVRKFYQTLNYLNDKINTAVTRQNSGNVGLELEDEVLTDSNDNEAQNSGDRDFQKYVQPGA